MATKLVLAAAQVVASVCRDVAIAARFWPSDEITNLNDFLDESSPVVDEITHITEPNPYEGELIDVEWMLQSLDPQ